MKIVPKMQLNKDKIWQVCKITIAVTLVGVVVSEVSLKSIVVSWQRISLTWFLLSILAFYAVLWSIARRYWVLIGRRITFHEVLYIVFYQNIMGNLIATAAGAAWYVGILRNKHNVQITNGLLSLLLARFGDLVALLVCLSSATLIVWQQIPTLHVVVTVVIFFLLAIALFSILMLVLRHQLVKFASGMLDKYRLREKAGGRRIFTVLSDLSNQEIDKSTLSVGAFTAYSVLTLGTMLLFAYSSLQIFGVRIGIWPVIFVVSLTQIMTLVPIQVFGGLGLYDFTYLYLYGLFGMDRSEFATVVVGLRISFYLVNLALLPFIGITTPLTAKTAASDEIP